MVAYIRPDLFLSLLLLIRSSSSELCELLSSAITPCPTSNLPSQLLSRLSKCSAPPTLLISRQHHCSAAVTLNILMIGGQKSSAALVSSGRSTKRIRDARLPWPPSAADRSSIAPLVSSTSAYTRQNSEKGSSDTRWFKLASKEAFVRASLLLIPI